MSRETVTCAASSDHYNALGNMVAARWHIPYVTAAIPLSRNAGAAFPVQILIVALAIHSARAQTGAMAGSVVSATTRIPLPQCEIVVPAVQRSARCERDGRYRLGNLPAGEYWVVARSIGYASRDDTVSVVSDRTTTHDFSLAQTPTTLDTVIAAALSPRSSSLKLRGFEERRKQGFGRFITEEELRKNDDRKLIDLLRQIPGTRIIRDGRNSFLGSSRSQQIGSSTFGAVGTRKGPCYATIYIDDILIYDLGMTAGMPSGNPPNLDDYVINTLMGIEFYAAEATLPQGYKSSGCGTLLVWTRDRH